MCVTIIIIIIINKKINVAYSPKTSRTRNKQKKKTATRLAATDGATGTGVLCSDSH